MVHPYLDDPKDFFEITKDEHIMSIPKKGANNINKQKAEYTIEMFNLNSEARLTELAKQIHFERNSEEIKNIVLEISTYME